MNESAIRIGCNAADAHLTCSYPDCKCKQLPVAIQAALNSVTPAALMGVQRPEDVARIVEIVNTSLGPLNATECADLGEEIAAVLALPHTIAPEDVKRVLAVAHPDMQDHDFSADAAEIAAHTGQPQEGIPLQEFQAVQDACERFRRVLTEISSWTADPIAKKTALNALSAAPASPQRAEGKSKPIADQIALAAARAKVSDVIVPPAPQAGCAKDWQLVPIEPTREMYDAGARAINQERNRVRSQGGGEQYGDTLAVLGYRAMLAASPPPPVAESGWREIETAPKQIGKFIILYCPEDNSRWLASWQTDRWYGVDDCGLTRNDLGWTITHWQPLPAPPHIADQRPEVK